MKKTFLLILLAFLILFFIRLLSGEDNWICQNGKWVRHGNPSAAMPSGNCQKR